MNEDIKITYARNKTRGAVLKVIGVGGGGGNAINRMIDEGMRGVDFIAINTDIQDLSSIQEPAQTLQIGEKITKGLGTGSNSEIGMQAALENTEQIIELLEGANMVFITAGMGGGTGTGASQVIANHSSSMGILTVAVVTKPFEFEGSLRMKVADDGIKNLLESVDAMIVIPNQKLFEIEEAMISYKDAYKKVDEILLKAVKGISDIINNPGYQNVDFADVKSVMSEKGLTLMGTGEARGDTRAEEAIRKALNSPLLDNLSVNGATGILYNITASSSLTLKEIGMIANIVQDAGAPDAKIKFGIVDDETMQDLLRVTVVATGVKQLQPGEKPRPIASFKPAAAQPTTVQKTEMPFARTPTDLFSKPIIQPAAAQAQANNNSNYFYKRKSTPVTPPPDLNGYLNESTLPSMLKDPENVDDFLDVPSFQRPKITEKR